MRISFFVLLSLISFQTLASTSATWTCEAASEDFFANPFFEEFPEERFSIGQVPQIRWTLRPTDQGLVSDLQFSGSREGELKNLPATGNEISPTTVGIETYQVALKYLSTMMDSKIAAAAEQYVSYSLFEEDGAAGLVGIEFFQGDQVIERALLFPGGEVVGACRAVSGVEAASEAPTAAP